LPTTTTTTTTTTHDDDHDDNDDDIANDYRYWTPFDILHQLDKKWLCAPGTCGAYASPGYDILGLALAVLYNCSTWQEFDLLHSVVPASVIDQCVSFCWWRGWLNRAVG
jgi:hypothetical protein